MNGSRDNSLGTSRPNGSRTERRSEERRECFLAGKIAAQNATLSCFVNNIAPNGIGISLSGARHLSIAETVTINTSEFGAISGVVRWDAHPRYGITIPVGKSQTAQFRKFYESLSVERIISERREFLQIDAATSASLKALKPLIDRELPHSLDTFYGQVRATPSMKAFFSGDAHMDNAKNAQLQHWGKLVNGEFGADYFNSTRRIGSIHARVGLEPRWYIDSYGIVLGELVKSIVAAHRPRSLLSRDSGARSDELGNALAALIKAAFLDMDISLSVYFDQTEQARLEGEAAAIAHERAMVSDSIGKGLEKLAQKDLAYRLNDDLPEAYEPLRDNFNHAIEQFEEALKLVNLTSNAVLCGSREIISASDDLSRQTEQQAAGLEESVAALSHLTTTVRSTADSARSVLDIILDTDTDAERSGGIMRNAVAAIDKIESSSVQINEIISVIDEIAFQTNLLALNAGVEAARAGDSGRGFAVVATEVRALAQRSATAAKEIKTLIAGSASQVSEGVKLVGEAETALERIVGKIAEIKRSMGNIAADAQEQSTGLGEVNQAMLQMDETTQRNAAMAEETTAVCHSLAQESERLADLISKFTITTDSREQAQVGKPYRKAS